MNFVNKTGENHQGGIPNNNQMRQSGNCRVYPAARMRQKETTLRGEGKETNKEKRSKRKETTLETKGK